jgi:hypothetical protein
MSDTSGSRWEPTPDEQPTQRLAVERPADPAPASRRLGRVVGAAAVVAATLAGGAVGAALAGNRTAEVNETAVVDDVTPGQTRPYRDRDGDGFGPRGGGHGWEGH